MEVKKKEKGIMLIVLVVTIIVLIILATISIYAILRENGQNAKSQQAKDYHNQTKQDEPNKLNNYANYTNATNENAGSDKPTGGVGVKVTIEGETVTLTKDNYASYLGKVVTNYKTKGGTETVKVNTANYNGTSAFTVSTTYRLYYIDFDNKYGDGAGTVYLKADCTSNDSAASTKDIASIKDITSGDTIKNNLNPSLYKSGVTAPKSTNENMRRVTWLLDTTEWEGLVKSGASTDIGTYVNYVVGAPTLEMMIDSFNTHYGLTGDTPDHSPRSSSSTRTKLFYKYAGQYGYAVGPSSHGSSLPYADETAKYTVQSDNSIDSMYYPGIANTDYWLASPSDRFNDCVLRVSGLDGGKIVETTIFGGSLCPLVSLKSSVQLELE